MIKASPPNIILFSSSMSVSQLVTKIIGTFEKPRISEQIEIIDYLWDNQLYVDDNALSVNINRIRDKLASIKYCSLSCS